MTSDQNHSQDRATDAAKAGFDRAADHGTQFAGAAQDGLRNMSDMRDKAVEGTRGVVQSGLELASHQAREVSERFTRNFGLGDEESRRLAERSKQDLDTVARCGTVLTQAYQDASRGWFELGQKQIQRGFDALHRLAQVRTTHEFASVQSELLRENMQQLVQDGRAIAERSLRAADDAGKTFARTPTQA